MERTAGKRKLLARSILFLSALLFMVSCHHDHDNTAFIRPSVLSLTAGSHLDDFVIRGEFNAYAVSVVPGALYKISITRVNDDADLLFFGTDSSFTNLAACGVDNTELGGITAEDCIIAAPGSTLYFEVDGSFLAANSASYTIAVEPVLIQDVNLSIPVLDSATQRTAVLYRMPVTAGAYTAAITGLDNNADLYVFGTNSNFSAPVACNPNNTFISGTTPEDCTLTLGAGTFFFLVDGIFSSTSTVLYTAFATEAPSIAVPINEGATGAPVTAQIDVPREGQVGTGGTSYYEIGVTAGPNTISINGLTAGANLAVFSDINFRLLVTCLIDNTFLDEDTEDKTAESCTFVAEENSVIFFSVTANSGGARFITLVEPGP